MRTNEGIHSTSQHRLLPQPKKVGYNFRERTNNLTSPTDVNAVIKHNSVYRMLFRDTDVNAVIKHNSVYRMLFRDVW